MPTVELAASREAAAVWPACCLLWPRLLPISRLQSRHRYLHPPTQRWREGWLQGFPSSPTHFSVYVRVLPRPSFYLYHRYVSLHLTLAELTKPKERLLHPLQDCFPSPRQCCPPPFYCYSRSIVASIASLSCTIQENARPSRSNHYRSETLAGKSS